jgi:hypothetical protein
LCHKTAPLATEGGGVGLFPPNSRPPALIPFQEIHATNSMSLDPIPVPCSLFPSRLGTCRPSSTGPS